MKQRIKNINGKLEPILNFLKRYVIIIFIVGMLSAFGFIVFRINQFSNLQPSTDAINEKLQSSQRPKIDQSIIDKIQQLQNQHIEVKSLFDQARNNPFSE